MCQRLLAEHNPDRQIARRHIRRHGDIELIQADRGWRKTGIVYFRGHVADKDLNGCGDSVIGIKIPEDGKIAFESQNLIRELRRLSGKERVARAGFEVIGTLTENERDCFAARYVIRVQQILPVGSPSPEVVSSSALANELQGTR